MAVEWADVSAENVLWLAEGLSVVRWGDFGDAHRGRIRPFPCAAVRAQPVDYSCIFNLSILNRISLKSSFL